MALHQSRSRLSASHRDARRAPQGKQVAGVGACSLQWSFAPWHEIFPAILNPERGPTMSRTESTMVPLGTIAPTFELADVLTGRAMSRDDVFALSWDDNLSDAANAAVTGGPAQKHGLLVMFLSVHCPFVKHVEQEIANIARDYAGKIAFCAIMSNDVAAYPQDSPDNMRAQAKRLGWNFPYLYDETQEVARSYNAACTPDIFLFNGAMELVY